MKHGSHHIISVSNGKGWCEHCEDYVDLEDMNEECEGNVDDDGAAVIDDDPDSSLPEDDVPDVGIDDLLDDLL